MKIERTYHTVFTFDRPFLVYAAKSFHDYLHLTQAISAELCRALQSFAYKDHLHLTSAVSPSLRILAS